MSANVDLDEAFALALKLSPKERIQLIERLASVKREIEQSEPQADKPALKTGAEIAAMLGQMNAIEFVDPEIDDPTEWVRAQRQKQADRLKPYWDSEK